MSMWDKLLPHRFFINRALRTASNELRDYIDSYRIQQELAIQECRDEIEAAKAEKDRQFELMKQEYLNELSQDSDALGELQTLLLDYANDNMKKQLLYLSKQKTMREVQLLNEYGDFLTAQMKLLGDEITILEHRQASLALQVKTDDVVALIGITGADLSCDDSDNPKTLIEKVNSILFERNDLLPQTKAALFRLRKLLQERAEYLPLIDYISWLITQKKNLCKDLSRERSEVNKTKKLLKDQLFAIKTELNQINETMLRKAVCIRNVWSVPLADISVELATVTETLSQMYRRQEYIRAEIRTMKSERSHDSDRWERLQAEGKSVYEAIGQLKSTKTKLYEQRQQWFHRKNAVLSLFKKNNIFLLSPKGDKTSDEIRVLKLRRIDYCEKIDDIDSRLKECTAQILEERDQQKAVHVGEIQTAKKTVSEKKRSLAEVERRVKSLKEKDGRSFIARILSESEDVVMAKAQRNKIQHELLEAEQCLAILQGELKTVHATYEKQLSQANDQYKHRINDFQKSIASIDLAVAFLQKKRRK